MLVLVSIKASGPPTSLGYGVGHKGGLFIIWWASTAAPTQSATPSLRCGLPPAYIYALYAATSPSSDGRLVSASPQAKSASPTEPCAARWVEGASQRRFKPQGLTEMLGLPGVCDGHALLQLGPKASNVRWVCPPTPVCEMLAVGQHHPRHASTSPARTQRTHPRRCMPRGRRAAAARHSAWEPAVLPAAAHPTGACMTDCGVYLPPGHARSEPSLTKVPILFLNCSTRLESLHNSSTIVSHYVWNSIMT